MKRHLKFKHTCSIPELEMSQQQQQQRLVYQQHHQLSLPVPQQQYFVIKHPFTKSTKSVGNGHQLKSAL